MFVALMTFAAVAGFSATPASDLAVETALSRCLGSLPVKAPSASEATDIPPGLIEGSAVSAVPIAGATRAFSYEGTNQREVTCGVALYGPVSHGMYKKISALIGANPTLKPHAIDAYDLSERFPGAEEVYWGDPFAPSMKGVAMLSRKPNAQAPTLEIEYHAVMVQ